MVDAGNNLIGAITVQWPTNIDSLCVSALAWDGTNESAPSNALWIAR
jgi:hypothetical protein